jgi:anti-anti-sigma regulatory factor
LRNYLEQQGWVANGGEAVIYGNPTYECGAAQIRAHCRQLATVVTICGVIDDTNLESVSQRTTRFILDEKPFVLDLSAVNSFPSQSISLLCAVDDACLAAGVEWSLITSPAVERAMHDDHIEIPATASVPDALHHFADVRDERRRLLPLLGKTA